jgi:predicted 3-demethylubiquinone-9 3-methyltransferase (glyoxalase superfamily)
MQGIRPFLSFKDNAEEALNLYVSVIPNSRITSMMKSEEDGPIAKGKVFHATFELDGREFAAMDGGPTFSFSEGFSLFVTCDTQEEVDRVWARLTENGGQPGPCGWLTDPYGLSWQVIPAALGELMGDPEHGNSQAVMGAMLKMGKLDIAELRRAYATPVEAAR